MFTSTRIALCLAVVLGPASGALAAPKHAVHHGKHTVTRSSWSGAYGSNAAASGGDYTFIGPNLVRTPAGNINRCRGGSCSPNWSAWEDAQ